MSHPKATLSQPDRSSYLKFEDTSESKVSVTRNILEIDFVGVHIWNIWYISKFCIPNLASVMKKQ